MEFTAPNVTHIGMGNMGAALAQAFVKANFDVTLWNRTADRPGVKSAVEAGGKLDINIASAISKSSIITICVLEYATVYQILGEVAKVGGLRGKTVINFTTGTPKQAREADSFVKEHGAARYFDCAVMAFPQAVGTPECLIAASGETEETFNAEIQPVLVPTGIPMYRGQDVGAASLFDTALLSMLWGTMQGALTMIALLKKQKPDPSIELIDGKEPRVASLVSSTIVPMGQAILPMVGALADDWDKRKWSENSGYSVGVTGVSIKHMLETYADEGINQESLKPLLGFLQKAIKDHGEEANFAVTGTYMTK